MTVLSWIITLVVKEITNGEILLTEALYPALNNMEKSRRIVNGTWQLNNTLANNLIAEGKQAEAKQVMTKSMRDLPSRNYSIVDTLGKLHTVHNLHSWERLTKPIKFLMLRQTS